MKRKILIGFLIIITYIIFILITHLNCSNTKPGECEIKKCVFSLFGFRFSPRHKSNCCGNQICESKIGETEFNCPQDCSTTLEKQKNFLEEKIHGLSEYPELGEFFVVMYSRYGYFNYEVRDEEIRFMQIGLQIYIEKSETKEYSRENMIHLMTWEVPKVVLEEDIPEIVNYPELEEVFIDLFAADAFDGNETYHMRVGLEIYKQNPKLKNYPKEALIYLMSRAGFSMSFYDAEFFNNTLIPLAEEITADTENDLDAVKAINRWVNNNIIYKRSVDYGPGDVPEDVLETKFGVCSDFSILIMGLSKAIGIPARYIFAVPISEGPSHAWVEVYIDGNWIPIASTGTLDFNNDVLIEYLDLVELENNKMVDVFIHSPYHGFHSRTDITFGYNNHIIQQMITEVENMLEENYNLEAKENLDSAKNALSLWETKKSTEDRNRIGREAVENLLRTVAILEKNVTGDQVYVAFLEDFPLVKQNRPEGKITSTFWTEGVTQSANTNNPLVFWENFQETLIEENPKILYLFDASYKGQTKLYFATVCSGIDFNMLQKIDYFIKNKELDTELNFALYWSDKESSEKIEFLEYEDIEPVITLTEILQDDTLFETKILDFMWNFIDAVNSVKDNVTETSFYLPPKFDEKYDYHIAALGGDIREFNFSKESDGNIVSEKSEHLGWSLKFGLIIKTNIGELPLDVGTYSSGYHGYDIRIEGDTVKRVEIGDDFPYYNNLIIVDETGDILRPDGKNGYYYSECPSGFVHLDPGQTLIIEREGDYIKITETGKA